MSSDFSCGLTASFLDSGRILANAGNALAIVAGIGCVVAGPSCGRWVLAGSLLVWFVECWFAVRVAIDSSLFRVLAANPEEAGRQLDAMLFRTATVRERPLADRTRGAMNLWRKQIVALAVQLAALVAGIILKVANI
jgi:type IV secretory pathway TrbD component